MRRIILAVLLAAGASLLAGCAGMTDGSATDGGSDARQAERHQRPSGGY